MMKLLTNKGTWQEADAFLLYGKRLLPSQVATTNVFWDRRTEQSTEGSIFLMEGKCSFIYEQELKTVFKRHTVCCTWQQDMVHTLYVASK